MMLLGDERPYASHGATRKDDDEVMANIDTSKEDAGHVSGFQGEKKEGLLHYI